MVRRRRSERGRGRPGETAPGQTALDVPEPAGRLGMDGELCGLHLAHAGPVYTLEAGFALLPTGPHGARSAREEEAEPPCAALVPTAARVPDLHGRSRCRSVAR